MLLIDFPAHFNLPQFDAGREAVITHTRETGLFTAFSPPQ
jgi:hypothetical protein